MRLVHKVLLALALPVALVWFVGVYAAHVSEQGLRSSIEGGALVRAQTVRDEIERTLRSRAAGWQAFVRSRLVRDAVAESNAAFAAIEDPDAWIARTDARWRALPSGENSELMDSLVSNALATELAIRREVLLRAAGFDVFPEAFVTNRFGANIAQTNRTSDYLQSDEEWWQRAATQGLYVGEVEFDESAGVHSVGLGIRIEDERGELAGVLKAVLDIHEVFEIADAHAVLESDLRIFLYAGDGSLIRNPRTHDSFDPGPPPPPDTDPTLASMPPVAETRDPSGRRFLHAYARSAAHSASEPVASLTNWTVLARTDASRIFAPVDKLRRDTRVVLLGAVVMAIAIAMGIAGSLLSRIRSLADAAERLGQGELDTTVAIGGRDELARLGGSFNQMAEELREANHRLVDARDAAEAANEAKTRFLANMSHELRTPMNGVLGMGELLSKTSLDSEQRDFVEVLQDSARSLLRLLNEILDISKIEADRIELESVDFGLRDCIDRAVRMLSVRASEKSLALECRVDPELPDRLRGDPERFRQIFLNIGGNAIKFTEKGTVAIDVAGGGLPGGEVELRVEVHDTGIGIPEEKQEAIFEAFSQADTSTTRRYGGTGLGLSISAKLVALMGGEIQVESAPGNGTTFRFSVRFERGAEPAPAVASPPETRPASPARRILLAEDGPVNQRVAAGLLERLGHDVTVAEHGRAALDALSRAEFDCVLMDIQMPEMDGIEATTAIRDREREAGGHLPIIAVTAAAMESDRERCLKAGMDGYLAKPYRLDELEAVLAALPTIAGEV